MAASPRKPPGRPPAFDRERALDRAMWVFWEKGYEGASLCDLTRAMDIRPPSLYAAFGSKQALFEESLARYLAGPGSFVEAALAEPTAREVAARILRQSAEFLTARDNRGGCMTIEAALVGGDEAAPLRRKLTRLRIGFLKSLQERFARARSEGDLPASSDPAALARFVTTVFQGMTVQAIDGATREELLLVVDTALRAWPVEPPAARGRQ